MDKEYFENIVFKVSTIDEQDIVVRIFKENRWIEPCESFSYCKSEIQYFHPMSGDCYSKPGSCVVYPASELPLMIERISKLLNATNKPSAYKYKYFEGDNMYIIELYLNHFTITEQVEIVDMKVMDLKNDQKGCFVCYKKDNDFINEYK